MEQNGSKNGVMSLDEDNQIHGGAAILDSPGGRSNVLLPIQKVDAAVIGAN